MQLCEEVADGLADRGHQIALLTGTRCDGPEIVRSYPVHRLLTIDPDWQSGKSAAQQFFVGRRQREQAAVSHLSHVVERFGPQIIFVWDIIGLPRTLLRAAEAMLPTVYYLADFLPEVPDEYIPYWRSAPISRSARVLKRPIAGLALAMLRREGKPIPLKYEHVICVSGYVRRRLAEQRLIPDDSAVVHNGVDLSVFTPSRRAGRFSPAAGLSCLVAGRVVPDKGIHTVIDALALLKAQAASLSVTILGDGPQSYANQLRTKALAAGLESVIRFQPKVPRDCMPQVLEQYDVLLLPSEYGEPIARSMQEAMAVGLLVIGTTTGGSGELLVHEQTGLVFEAGSPHSLAHQLERALADPCAAASLAAAGQARVRESFRIDQTVSKVEAYLQSVIGSHVVREAPSVRLLVVSDWFPDPPISGAKIRAHNLIRQLARFGEIDLVAQVNTLSPEQVAAGTARLRQFCSSVQSVPAVPYHYSLGRAVRTLVDPVPAAVRHKRNLALEELLFARLRTRYDAVVATISGFPSATLASLVRLGVRPLIADSLELGVMRPKPSTGCARRVRNQFTWWRLRRFTGRLLRDVDVVTVASKTERALFTGLMRAPDKCIVVPNVLDLADYTGDFGPRDFSSLLYAGSFGYIANYEAMLWFTQEVFGRIESRESLRVRVTGSTAGRDLAPLRNACPQIEFSGFVNDIRPCFAQAGICIVPIQSGGSTRLKIIEAMAWGTPVVSTRAGAEGLDVAHDHDILLADTPDEFATGIARLVGDRALWQRLSSAGRDLVARHYSADRMYEQYRCILSRDNIGVSPMLKGV